MAATSAALKARSSRPLTSGSKLTSATSARPKMRPSSSADSYAWREARSSWPQTNTESPAKVKRVAEPTSLEKCARASAAFSAASCSAVLFSANTNEFFARRNTARLTLALRFNSGFCACSVARSETQFAR